MNVQNAAACNFLLRRRTLACVGSECVKIRSHLCLKSTLLRPMDPSGLWLGLHSAAAAAAVSVGCSTVPADARPYRSTHAHTHPNTQQDGFTAQLTHVAHVGCNQKKKPSFFTFHLRPTSLKKMRKSERSRSKWRATVLWSCAVVLLC